ncbi:serine hydrolase domain-containing protein [Mucilaginibacter paludis]|uniref:Beta-lactamase n=1 Tax=Mucilaginibacter paludis DSM 18603 TaxID=714943 RepID=H1YGF8_9SPHI|nr:serine hydrolase [Mucilaginibacter paludis]EHQ24510.1 beta-lactamase [Mucilaginibacter paludis DSM 18603]
MKVKHLLNTVVLCHFFVLSAYAQKQHSINEQWLNERKNIEKTTVLLNNQQRAVPILNLAGNKIASISFGLKESAVFDSILNNYATVKSFRAADYQLAPATLADLSYDVKFFNTLIISVNNTDLDDGKLLQFITDNLKSKTIIVTAFGDVHMLAKLKNVKVPVMWTAQQSALSANYVAQAIIGGMPVVAKLPVNVSAKYRKGDGFLTQVTRLSYTVPEEVGVNIAELENPIDSIAAEAISKRATPSAVIMVVKDGKVIFNKAYGHHTYDGVAPTKTTDIYDLASITKVTATTPSVMRLVEQGKLNLDSTISNYIPKVRQTDKKDIKVRQVMLHQAGFIPFIPFFKSIKPGDFSRDSSAAYPVKAGENYFFRKNYFRDVMWPQMLNSPVRDTSKYVYSDLSMYFMKEIVEGLSNEHLENYVQENFYRPLGMQTAGYLPLYRFSKDRIIPTEVDTLYRNMLLVGYVHDPGAAMVGGVSGHAGLFASSTDLAIFYQMLLNGGSYGGKRYFKPATVKTFTSSQSMVSSRGYGFDRKRAGSSYPSAYASVNTFGHTGYTGTRVWVDPEYKLVYILLTNRVNPVTSTALFDLNISQRISDAIYHAFHIDKKQ